MNNDGDFKNTIFVVMADNSLGEFLWCREDNEDPLPLCGSNMYSLMDRDDPDPIMSIELFRDFCFWAELYLVYVPTNDDVFDFDWDDFNKKGLELAQRLKAELGRDIKVRYVKPPDDPNRNRTEFTEIR